uniref:Uncharacterized protein n=1 Tax=Tetradesmus obliquus TaxID=3088 RepID=A0A383VX03_TETOB|eukprot:jgi/Sobl393_1/3425/SZX68946.1
MINQCSQQLLAIPGVPLAAAKALVQRGLRVQITAQELVAAAYACSDSFRVWVEAFSAAAVPLEEWAADLPAELRLVCCYDGVGKYVNEHLLMDLTPARAADALAVALNVLAVTFKKAERNQGLPAAAQLPTAAVVELAQQAVRVPGPHRGPHAVHLAVPFLRLLAFKQLTAEQVGELLSLLRGPAAAAEIFQLRFMPGLNVAAADWYGGQVPRRVKRSVMAWLASQPGAAAAAARLGLTADDVRDPEAAALLFGSQQAAAAADGM